MSDDDCTPRLSKFIINIFGVLCKNIITIEFQEYFDIIHSIFCQKIYVKKIGEHEIILLDSIKMLVERI